MWKMQTMFSDTDPPNDDAHDAAKAEEEEEEEEEVITIKFRAHQKMTAVSL